MEEHPYARDVIQKGMVWRIGNGHTTRIKEDNWLLVKSNRTVTSPLTSLPPDSKVSSLINQDLGVWKSEMVKRLFLPYEASIILGIPLSSRLPLD